MVQNHALAKGIHDAAWRQFANLLACKAAWASRRYVAVNPAYTSQDCSSCGHRQPLTFADRTYTCPGCGLVLDCHLNRESEHFESGATLSGFSPEAPGFRRGELSQPGAINRLR